ncbi:DHH family phosphoesterase [Xylocopilactobacillus apicola]|uniref:Phosphoesterase n=1 Tax=Xylocopilactobacillus apicola TaxID=2932184 RepID=A0AAU9D8W9_9LACO|nr:bifunctional oligoribonuclease/PAP phosphatase NrnA [Xylocopilactobacillus apicola]BDR58841.1 phosphoesterase [Xylocopilactobacillus apicola]
MNDQVEKILNLITSSSQIIVLRHQHPDPDALGSQLGLAEILRNSFPSKKIKVGGINESSLSWVGSMDNLTDQDFAKSLVIVTDTANTPRIDDERYHLGQGLIKIDHHPDDDPYGTIRYVVPEASSSSEILWDLVSKSHGKLKINSKAARLLYLGIVGDTGRFLYSNATAHTFEVTADLLKHEFNASEIAERLSEITLGQGRLQGYVLEHLTISQSGAAMVIVYRDTLQEYQLNMDQAHTIVSVPGHLSNVKAWVVFVQKRDLTFRVHLRSKGVAINEIAKSHHGGGHALASGADAEDERELSEIYKELERAVESYK